MASSGRRTIFSMALDVESGSICRSTVSEYVLKQGNQTSRSFTTSEFTWRSARRVRRWVVSRL